MEKQTSKEAIIICEVDGITKVSYEMLWEHQGEKKSFLLTGLERVEAGEAQKGDIRARIFQAEQAKRTELAIEQVRSGMFGGAWRRDGPARPEAGPMAFRCF